MSAPTHRLSSFRLDELEYAKKRISMYNELPTKGQLLTFIMEVEARLETLGEDAAEHCPDCTCYDYGDEDEE